MLTKLIFDWAQKEPDRTAVIHNDRPYSYRQFAQAIAAARLNFAAQGCAGPGEVLLTVRNLMEFWVFSLALRGLGLTTTAAPSSEVIAALDLPNLSYVVTSSADPLPGLDSRCGELGLRLISASLDDLPTDGAAPMTEGPHPPGGHILFTSGTTGLYKKVLITPAMDAIFLRRTQEIFSLGRDCVLCVFDFPPWTAAGYRLAATPWVEGGTVVIRQGGKWRDALSRPGLTHAFATPTMLATILAALEGSFPRNEALRLTVGGGAMTGAQIDQVKARITPRLYSHLASTEAGCIAFTALDNEDDRRWHRPIPDRKVELVDEFDNPVPIGQTGRVRIGNQGGPAGYLYAEETTSGFFKDGFFYPGDLGVLRDDGRLALQGRFNDVMNVNGYKISPAPIEDDLCQALGVSGACLVSIENKSGEEEVHLMIETQKPIDPKLCAAVLERELRGFTRAQVHFLAALPRNAAGKLLRDAARNQILAMR